MKYQIPYQVSITTITQNKRVRHEYFIEKEFEAGLSLLGWEVKSLRAGMVHIKNSYVLLKKNEAFLLGLTLKPLIDASSHIICDPIRSRKLLLRRHELDSLLGQVHRKGYTIVPISLYWNNSIAKIKLGIAKGKRKYDKRHCIKEREWLINKARITKFVDR